MSLLLQCLHCKKTDHEKLMCFVKYPHKKKKLDAAWAVKKKSKSLLSDKFSDRFFNNVKSTFNKTDDNVTMLSFMSVIESHLMSVWIVNTEASDHLCFIHKFFLIYEPISRSLKMVNEPAQIIEKNMISLCLVHSNSDIQEIILKDVMHASDFSANLVLTAAYISDISFNMCDCTLCHKTMSSNMLLRSTGFFSYTSMIHLSLMSLQLIMSLRYHLICDIDAWVIYKHWVSV
jgi:hypothetical protein